MNFVFEEGENTVRNGENAGYQHDSPMLLTNIFSIPKNVFKSLLPCGCLEKSQKVANKVETEKNVNY